MNKLTQKYRGRHSFRAFVTFTAFIIITFVTLKVDGAFEQVGVGARPGAMANAFTAVGGDAHSVFFNPAGLAMMRQSELISMYSRLFVGLSDKSDIGASILGYGQPLGKNGRLGTTALGLWRLSLDDLFAEQIYALAYARPWGEFMDGKFYWGGTLKQLVRSYGTTPEIQNAINLAGNPLGNRDPVLANKRSKTGFDADLGLLYNWREHYSLGLALQNVNEPDMALGAQDKDPVPMTLRSGFSFEALNALFSLDFTQRESIPGRQDRTLSLGAERAWTVGLRDSMVVRAGLATGSRGLRQANFGLGYQIARLSLGYAFNIPLAGISGTDGSHQLSLSFRFGKPDSEKMELERLLKEEQTQREEAQEALGKATQARLEAEEKLAGLSKELEALKAQGPSAAPKPQQDEQLLKLEEDRRRAEEAQEKAKQQEAQAAKALEAAYRLSWSYYEKRVAAQAGTQERMELLEKIIKKYAASGLDVGLAVRELLELKKETNEVQSDFEASWQRYKTLETQGATIETRVEVLRKIIEKFQGKKVDLAPARQELKRLAP